MAEITPLRRTGGIVSPLPSANPNTARGCNPPSASSLMPGEGASGPRHFSSTPRAVHPPVTAPRPAGVASGEPGTIRARRPLPDAPLVRAWRPGEVRPKPRRSSPTLREWLHIFSELLTVMGGLAVLGLLMVMA